MKKFATKTQIEMNGSLIALRCAAAGFPCFSGLSGSVVLDGVEHFLRDAKPTAEGWLLDNGIEWKRRIEDDGDSVIIHTFLVNRSDRIVRIGEWNILYCAASEEGKLEHDAPTALRHFRNVRWDCALNRIDATPGKPLESEAFFLLNDGRNGKTLFIAFATLDRMMTSHRLVWDGAFSEYRAACDGGGRELDPGEETEAEQLRVRFGDVPETLLEEYADGLYRRYRPDFTGTLRAELSLGYGAGSWEERIHAVTDFADKHLAGFGLKTINGGMFHLMEDGLPGHWMKFRRGADGTPREAVLKKLHAKGWNFKLWFSPFWFFAEAEETLAANRGNLVRKADGTPLTKEFRGGWEFSTGKLASEDLQMYFLDGTHPATLEFLRKVMTFYRDLGVRGYMLDFLSLPEGAELYDRKLYPVEAAAKIFRTIREAAGRDSHLQTAVRSTPAYVGLINSARVVRDFGEGRPIYPKSNWQNAVYCMHDRHFSNLHAFLQNAAALWFYDRKVFVNDLNDLRINLPVPLNFAQAVVTIFGLFAGSPIALADDLTRMAPERLAMLKLLLPRTDGGARPVDFFARTADEGGCRLLKKTIRTDWDEYLLLGAFNTAPEASIYEEKLDFARLGLDESKAWRVFDFWNREYVGTFRGSFPVSVPQGECRLYRIAEARPYPWLLSTDMHIEQGRAEIKNLRWDDAARTLSGVATRPAGESGNIFLLMPRDLYLPESCPANTMKEVIDMQTVVSYRIDFARDEEPFELRFEKKDNDLLAHKGWLPYVTESEWLEYLKEHPLPGGRVIE